MTAAAITQTTPDPTSRISTVGERSGSQRRTAHTEAAVAATRAAGSAIQRPSRNARNRTAESPKASTVRTQTTPSLSAASAQTPRFEPALEERRADQDGAADHAQQGEAEVDPRGGPDR